MERTLLYVSRSLLDDFTSETQVETLVSKAQERNAELAVTGALVFSSRGFAQVLEGADEAIDALMESIKRDGRHTEISIVHDRPIESTAQSRPSTNLQSSFGPYIGRYLEPFLKKFESQKEDLSVDGRIWSWLAV